MRQLVIFVVISASFTELDGQQFVYFCDPAKCNHSGDCLLTSPSMLATSSTFSFSSNENGLYPYQCRCETMKSDWNWNCSSTNNVSNSSCFTDMDDRNEQVITTNYPMFITFAETYVNADGSPCSPQISSMVPKITSNTLAWVSYWCQGVTSCTINTEWIASMPDIATEFVLEKFATEVRVQELFAKEEFKFCAKETQQLSDPPLGSCFQLTPFLPAEKARRWCWEQGGELSGSGDPTVISNIVKTLIPNESEVGVWILNVYGGDNLRLSNGSRMSTASIIFQRTMTPSPLPGSSTRSMTYSSTSHTTTDSTTTETIMTETTTTTESPPTTTTESPTTTTETSTTTSIPAATGSPTTISSPSFSTEAIAAADSSTMTMEYTSSTYEETTTVSDSPSTSTDSIRLSRGLCVFPAFPEPRPVDTYTAPKCPGKCLSGAGSCIKDGQQGEITTVRCPQGYSGVQTYTCTWRTKPNEAHDYILDWTVSGSDNCVLQSCPLYNEYPFCRDACLSSTYSAVGSCPDGEIGTTTWQCWDNSTSAWSYEPSYDPSTCGVAICPAVNTSFPDMGGLALQWDDSLPGLLHQNCPAPYYGTVFFRCEDNGEWSETGPNTRDCKFANTNGKLKQCPLTCLNNFPNYCWNATYPGIVTQSCPPGKLGTAQWFCDSDGQWATELPDMSDCKSNVTYFNDAVEALNTNTVPPTDVIGNLSHNLINVKLVGGDINSVSNVSRLALEKQRAMLNASTDETKNFTASLCNLTDVLLSDEQVWWSVPLEKRRVEFESVMTITADSADLVSLYLVNEIFQVNSSSNIAIWTENRVDGYFRGQSYAFTVGETVNRVEIQLPDNFEEYDKSNVTRLTSYVLSSAARILSGDQNKLHSFRIFMEMAHVLEFLRNYFLNLPAALLSTPVLGISIGGEPTIFQNGTFVSLQFTTAKDLSDYITEPMCVFFDWNKMDWSDEGCRLGDQSDPNNFICECNHLTNFAVLMDITGLPIEKAWLDCVTVIGCSVSVVSLLLSMCIYHYLKARNTRYQININIFLNMLVAEILFLSGDAATASAPLCAVIAAAMQFFFLAMFMWMSLGAFHLYEQITRVFDYSKKMLYFYIFGYGIPAAIVTVALAVNQGEDYGTESFCWLDTTASSGIIWSFAGPVAATVLWNAFVITLAVHRVLNAQKLGAQKSPPSNWTWITGSLSLSVLFGVTWIFGFFYVSESTMFMAYIFTIVNSFQGLFVFLFECIINPQVRNEWRPILSNFKKRVTAPLRESWFSSSDWTSQKTQSSVDTFDTSVKLSKFRRLASFQTVRRLGVRLRNMHRSFRWNLSRQLVESDSSGSNISS